MGKDKSAEFKEDYTWKDYLLAILLFLVALLMFLLKKMFGKLN